MGENSAGRSLKVGMGVLLDGGALALLVLREHVTCVLNLLGRRVLLGGNHFLQREKEGETE